MVSNQLQWSIYQINFNPSVGHEQAGIRPAVVVSNDDINHALGTVTVVPLTSRKFGRHLYPNEALIPKGTGGVKKNSIALAHQIRSVNKIRLRKRFGYIDSPQIRFNIKRALASQLDLSTVDNQL